jgi:hypothetical protein
MKIKRFIFIFGAICSIIGILFLYIKLSIFIGNFINSSNGNDGNGVLSAFLFIIPLGLGFLYGIYYGVTRVICYVFSIAADPSEIILNIIDNISSKIISWRDEANNKYIVSSEEDWEQYLPEVEKAIHPLDYMK